MGINYSFDGRKDIEPGSISNEESISFKFFTEKEITSFRPETEK